MRMTGLLVTWMLLAMPAAQAGGLYCSLNDNAAKRAYVSEVRRIVHESRLQLRNLASRFRRTVNVEYSTFFIGNKGVCHQFANPAAAAFDLGGLKARMENENIAVIVVGSF
jgi:hypothetical protein